MTRKEIIWTVEWRMVTELADDDLINQSRSGNATCDRPLRRGRTDDDVLATAAGILRTYMHMDPDL